MELFATSSEKEQQRCEQEEMDSSELINAVIWIDQQGVGIRCRSLLYSQQRCNKSVNEVFVSTHAFGQNNYVKLYMLFRYPKLFYRIHIENRVFLHVTSI